jgi:Dictyostelium (slime mold) repeat
LFRPARGLAQTPGGSDCVNQSGSCAAQKCCQGLICLSDQDNAADKFCCPDVAGMLVCGKHCCPTGSVVCQSGQCVCPADLPNVCPDPTNINFAGKCTDVQTDVLNCGQCGVVCPEPDPTGPNAPCRIRACVNGGCTTVPNPLAENLPCETGNLCTADTCRNGICTEGPRNVICPDEQCQSCNPSTGVCEPVADGTACDDGNACTVDDVCQAGLCTPGRPLNCDDGNECTTDSCDPATGCVHVPLTGTPCETGNRCTVDTCDNGVCKQGPVAVTCPQCQVCDTATGTCRAVANGTACEEGNLCTVGDTCQNGTCQPGPLRTCPPTGNPCTVSVCNPSTGICQVQPRPNGTSCNDANVCTTGDTCQSGVCVGKAVVCTGGQICCPAGMHAGTCKLPPGAPCSSNGSCCSNICPPGLPGTRRCA